MKFCSTENNNLIDILNFDFIYVYRYRNTPLGHYISPYIRKPQQRTMKERVLET